MKKAFLVAVKNTDKGRLNKKKGYITTIKGRRVEGGVFARNLAERRGPGKIKAFWENRVYVRSYWAWKTHMAWHMHSKEKIKQTQKSEIYTKTIMNFLDLISVGTIQKDYQLQQRKEKQQAKVIYSSTLRKIQMKAVMRNKKLKLN